MFDGLTGDLLKAELRLGTSKDVVDFRKPLLEMYDKDHPKIEMYIRSDCEVAVLELYNLLEKCL